MASYIAVPPPGRSMRTPRESASVSSVMSCVTSGVVSKPMTNALSYFDRMIWFRNSMAASCSNLKRSRTELLASMSNPTRSGRLVCRLNERTLSAGLLSSKTLKSFCVRSFTKWPRLSVTVKTTLTSSTRLRMTVRVSSGLSLFAVERSADAVHDLSDAPEVDGCEEAVGGAVTCDEELGSAGVGAAGAGDCAGVLDWLVPEGGGGADCWGGDFVADGAVGSCCSVEFWAASPHGSAASKTRINQVFIRSSIIAAGEVATEAPFSPRRTRRARRRNNSRNPVFSVVKKEFLRRAS